MVCGKRWSTSDMRLWIEANYPEQKLPSDWFYSNMNQRLDFVCSACNSEWKPRIKVLREKQSKHCPKCINWSRSADSFKRIKSVVSDAGYQLVDSYFASRPSQPGVKRRWLSVWCGTESHPLYEVSSANFRAGHRCPACAPSGFAKSKPAELYLLTRFKRDYMEFQYGISNVINSRLDLHKKNGWEIVDAISGPGDLIFELEQQIKNAMKVEGVYRRSFHDAKFDGWTEAWSAKDFRQFYTLDALLDWSASVDAREAVAA